MPTVKELKATLDVANVEYCKGARKAALQELVDELAPGKLVDSAPDKQEIPVRTDIKIDIAITMMDGSVHNKELSIVNPGGCIMRSAINNPDKVFEMIKQGLVQIYGTNHIKG